MFPEAGGSSSLRAARLQRVLVVLRRLGGDAHLHGDDRHLGVLRPALHRRRLRVRRRAADQPRATSSPRSSSSRCSRGVNVFGAKESTGINVTLAVVDFLTQLLLVLVGAILVLAPRCSSTTSTSASRPRGATSSSPSRSACSPTPASRRLEHGRGGQGRGAHDPGGDQPRPARRLRHLLHAARGRALRPAGRPGPGRRVPDAARPDRGGRRLRGRPGARRGQADRPRARSRASPRSTSACWPRRSSSSPRTRASSASPGSSTRWASTARCPTRCAACTRASARHGSGSSSSRAPRSC